MVKHRAIHPAFPLVSSSQGSFDHVARVKDISTEIHQQRPKASSSSFSSVQL